MNPSSNFFESTHGRYDDIVRHNRFLEAYRNPIYDLRLIANTSYRKSKINSRYNGSKNMLVVGVAVPTRANDLRRVFNVLRKTHHTVQFLEAPLLEGFGKFQNINSALKDVQIDRYDWLIVVDDDILIDEAHLDHFIYLAETTNLDICQPAHSFMSFQSFELTLRRWNCLVRVTEFVECGPFTAFRKSVFSKILPFPDTRWAWGTDVVWSEISRNEGYRMGIVDATPMRHLRPIASSYSKSGAILEGKELLRKHGIMRHREEILVCKERISTL